jgi:hypothetical protein
MSSNKLQNNDLIALQAKYGTSRMESRLTNSEIESLRKLKKERAIKIRQLIAEQDIAEATNSKNEVTSKVTTKKTL